MKTFMWNDVRLQAKWMKVLILKAIDSILGKNRVFISFNTEFIIYSF